MNITDSIAKDASGWDEAGNWGDVQLYDATLVVDTPKFKAGTKVEVITFLFSESRCQIWKSVPLPEPKDKTDGRISGTEMIDEFPITLKLA